MGRPFQDSENHVRLSLLQLFAGLCHGLAAREQVSCDALESGLVLPQDPVMHTLGTSGFVTLGIWKLFTCLSSSPPGARGFK